MPDQKIRVAVLFGGRSGEHEVSCASAASILTYLDRQRYSVAAVLIGRAGHWTWTSEVPSFASPAAALEWIQRDMSAAPESGSVVSSILRAVDGFTECDVVFPALHGPYGEDGTLQALLDGFGIPFVGNGVAASALSMDKEFTKKIAIAAGLEVADGVVLRRGEDQLSAADRDRLGLPVFVKPARDGSSNGVSKVQDWAELSGAIREARRSDEKVLVESAVPGREVDIGVLERPDGTLDVSPPMEILTSNEHRFFDRAAKYADTTTLLDVPAALDPEVTEALGRDALRLFHALGCAGLLRVDFFIRPDGSRVVNEVNTFPGFTSASQYPRMWDAAGLSYGVLLDVVIDTALRRLPTAAREREAPIHVG
jgi:D-alanine-D-alanine ligase